MRGRKCTGAPEGAGCEDGNGKRRGPARAASWEGRAAHGASRAGEFHAWPGFPRKSSLAAIWKAGWRKAQLGGGKALGRRPKRLGKKP